VIQILTLPNQVTGDQRLWRNRTNTELPSTVQSKCSSLSRLTVVGHPDSETTKPHSRVSKAASDGLNRLSIHGVIREMCSLSERSRTSWFSGVAKPRSQISSAASDGSSRLSIHVVRREICSLSERSRTSWFSGVAKPRSQISSAASDGSSRHSTCGVRRTMCSLSGSGSSKSRFT